MKKEKSVGLLFIISKKNEKPFDNLKHILKSYFKIDYNVFELKYYQFLNNFHNLSFHYFKNEKKKVSISKKDKNFNEFLSLVYQTLFQFYFGIKYFKKFFIKKFDKIIIISHGLKCFLLSYLLKKIFNKEIILVTFIGDRITENFNYFGLNFFNRFLNNFFSLLQYFVKKISLSSDLQIYESTKLLKHDRKKFKQNINYYLIQNSLINYDEFLIKNNKKVLKKNILFIGNFIDSGHLNYLIKLSEKLNNKFKFHIIGSCSKVFLNICKTNKNFKTYGYINNLNKLKNIISKCSFGTAFYNTDSKERKLVPSGKVNFYLQNSIPILSSNYSFENKQINKYKIGIASNNIDLISKFVKENSNQKKYSIIMNNLKKFNKKRKYDKNLKQLIKFIKKRYKF